MSNTLKKLIGVLASGFLLSIAYYGSYLPLRKSQTFIDTLRNLQGVSSVSDFEKAFSTPLDMPSPVGEEELVRNTANTVLGIIQNPNTNSTIAVELAKFVEGYYAPIIARGRGMSFEQNLYLLGAINELMFFKTRDPSYLQASDKYYSEGLQLGPKRPQFLYGLFDIYRAEGNVAGVQAVGNQILSQWPTDQNTQTSLNNYLAQIRQSTSTK